MLMLLVAACCCIALTGGATLAHPLGNFTINHFSRIELDGEHIRVRFIIDMAEIATLQELQATDTDGDGSPSSAELNAYLERVIPQYAEGLRLTVDGARVPLRAVGQRIAAAPRDGGLLTLRIECDFAGEAAQSAAGVSSRRLRFEDANHPDRIGWHEIVVIPATGTSVYNSNAYSDSFTDELKAYPEDLMVAPLNERTAELSFIHGAAPAGADAQPARHIASTVKMRQWSRSVTESNAAADPILLRGRESSGGSAITRSGDRLAELIKVPELTPLIALFGLFIAAGLGALHAFSPGHGKTVVGAYLVGSRGTAKHAAFLGLTVTVTHTLGVFALGVVTLFASQYIVPERLFPILSFISGAIVLGIGLTLFIRRLRLAFNSAPSHSQHSHAHDGGHAHELDGHAHDEHTPGGPAHTHDHAAAPGPAHSDATLVHSHDGGSEHSHLPPGADGGSVTWRSLLALGISGGLLPCPSALVVLLAAISGGKVAYGLLLVIAFSMGLAGTLTAIGLAFVFAGRWMKRPTGALGDRLVRVLPVASAFVIACVGAGICYEAMSQTGFNPVAFIGKMITGSRASLAGSGAPSFASTSALAALGLGLVFGLKHATEVDHIVAVSTIVSEQRKLSRAALVGALWGVGHTASLMIVGTVVLLLRVAIPERVANWLEFGVALMIIALGANALLRALRKRSDLHLHQHQHDADEAAHAHVHFHEPDAAPHDASHAAHSPAATHSHAVTRIGFKPLLVGAMHGLAGSAALTLLVLTQINSTAIGLLYLTVFGVGSIFGMLLMSGLIGLPFALSARRFKGIHYGLQALAGVVSIAFGFWYAYETGIATGILAFML